MAEMTITLHQALAASTAYCISFGGYAHLRVQCSIVDLFSVPLDIIEHPIRHLHHSLIDDICVGLDTEFELLKAFGNQVNDLTLDFNPRRCGRHCVAAIVEDSWRIHSTCRSRLDGTGLDNRRLDRQV